MKKKQILGILFIGIAIGFFSGLIYTKANWDYYSNSQINQIKSNACVEGAMGVVYYFTRQSPSPPSCEYK